MNLRRILVAVDTATTGTDVLAVADELARCISAGAPGGEGAAVALVSVADVRGIGVSETSPPVHVTAAKLREDAEKLLDVAASQFRHAGPPLRLVREGFPDKELIAAAHDWHADILIMGTHSRTGLAHMFKGSVAESVLHHAPCPVLLVKIGAKS